MKVRVAEIDGPALDWIVAVIQGHAPEIRDNGLGYMVIAGGTDGAYSSNWEVAGPIIESQRINLRAIRHGRWRAFMQPERRDEHSHQEADSPLVAAMRCHVHSWLGDEVDIPDELVPGFVAPSALRRMKP